MRGGGKQKEREEALKKQMGTRGIGNGRSQQKGRGRQTRLHLYLQIPATWHTPFSAPARPRSK